MEGMQRPFTRLPDTLNLGPTGARMWATYVRAVPGMEGSFEFIHKVNAPRLFGVQLTQDGKPVDLRFTAHKWFPSHLECVFEGGGLRLSESKFITWDDCAADVVRVSNVGASSVTVSLKVEFGHGPNNTQPRREWSFRTHGEEVYVNSGSAGPSEDVTLAPGESVEWTVGAAMALAIGDARSALRRWLGMAAHLETHKAEYDRFFDGAPDFECGDPAFEKMWRYRWYLVRRNLADPRRGSLPYPLFYEGRGAKMTLDPWKPQGWEFSKLIPFSTPCHILEGRWHRDPSACQGEILDLVRNQGDNGLLRCVYIDGTGGSYTDFTAWSAWQLYLVHPDREWLAQIGRAMVRQVDGTLKVFDEDGDLLPVVTNHGTTGKEYQPSFFHKGGYPDHPQKSQATPLERVDAACYLHMNADAASRIMAELGDDEEAARLAGIADGVKLSILDRFWDSGKRFFYDIDAAEHDRIPVENVVGSDPFLAGIADARHLGLFDRLFDPEQFWSPWPLRSTTKRCRAYAPDASWNGEHIKGPHGCVWNGPTWPLTNSTGLMALANAIAVDGTDRLVGLFSDLLRRYTMMCFRNGSIDDPMIYEHYNPETGQPISQEEDYFHSTWIDLIVRYVAGITPMPGGRVEFHPIDCGLESFSLRGVRVASHVIDVEFDRKTGFTASVDGRVDYKRPS